MHPEVQAFFDPATNTVSYVVHDPDTRAAAIIDPVLDFIPRTARISTQSADALLSAIADQGLDLRYVLETHAHADHVWCAPYSGKDGRARRHRHTHHTGSGHICAVV